MGAHGQDDSPPAVFSGHITRPVHLNSFLGKRLRQQLPAPALHRLKHKHFAGRLRHDLGHLVQMSADHLPVLPKPPLRQNRLPILSDRLKLPVKALGQFGKAVRIAQQPAPAQIRHLSRP